MSQSKYRSVDCKRVDWAAVAERLADAVRVVFPVDAAKSGFYGALMGPDREVVVTLRWRHPEETEWLLAELVARVGAERLEAVLEPTGSYGDALCWQLAETGIAVYRVAAKRVHDAAEVYDGVPSLHDAKAAYVIGRLHLEGVSRRWAPPSAVRRTLQAELALLALYRGRWQRGLNRLEARLARHWPEVPGCVSLGSVSLLRLLAAYGAPQAVAAEPEAAGALLRRASRQRLQPEQIEALVASAQSGVGVPCLSAERRYLQALAEDLLAVRRCYREQERHLVRQVPEEGELAHTTTAVGAVTAAVVYAGLGSAWDFPCPAAYQKAAGLNLKERSSGQHVGQLQITKRGPGVVRRYLYFAALRLMQNDPVVQRWVAAKAQRDGGTKAKAITAVMRKLIRALWHVARGAPFDTHRLFDTARLERAA